MSLLKKISQLRSLQGLVSKEAVEVTRLLLTSQQQRNKAAAKLQEFQSTYDLGIQSHNKLLTGNNSINPQLLSNTQAYLDKLQRDMDDIRNVICSAGADIIKYENILLKLLAKKRGYQKVTDSYIQDLRVTNEKRAYKDSARESSNKVALL